MKRVVGAGLLLAGAASQAILFDYCDAEYECEYRTPDYTRTFYDLKPLCKDAIPYVTQPSATGWIIKFQVCGTAAAPCVPNGYKPTYNLGTAVQFLDQNYPPLNCTDNAGRVVACTPNCEVVGTGVPQITVADPNNPAGGVNMSYYAVPDGNLDSFKCPTNPLTNGPYDRHFKLIIVCDQKAEIPVISVPYEPSTCSYEVRMRSKYGCGCQPNCGNSNCGPSACPGINCGPTGLGGSCPAAQTCAQDDYGTNYCCVPDCRGRQCGGDGCGGDCGGCAGGQECSRNQQCVATNVSPSPAPPVQTVTKSTTSGGDIFASYLGGVMSAVVGTLGVGYFRRVRSTLYDPLVAGAV